MNFTRFASLSLVSVALVAGCGSDEETKSDVPQGTVNESAVQTATQSIIAAVDLAVNGSDGPAAAFALAGAGASAFSIITPASNASGAPQAFGTARQAETTGTCECSGESCTFTDCGSDGTGGAVWTINGTMSWTSGSVDCDLTIKGDFQGFTYSMHEVCDLTYSSTSIDGSMKTEGSYDIAAQGAGNVSASWTSSITFNDVQYGAGGCPTSGSVDVAASFEVSSSGYEGSGSVSFTGAGC